MDQVGDSATLSCEEMINVMSDLGPMFWHYDPTLKSIPQWSGKLEIKEERIALSVELRGNTFHDVVSQIFNKVKDLVEK